MTERCGEIFVDIERQNVELNMRGERLLIIVQ
jgi:hypothetical protein